ncbi:MAG TPA: tetratricopeptide repeat protein, partial [Dehalococcoidia bacterium]|nr:tetratricopeptide repeat protein [Dehalococcoidia bacterium]
LDRAGGVQGMSTFRLSDFDLPRGVNELVQHRTRGLSAEAREILALAAVAGVSFDFSLLKEIAGRDADDLLSLIKELIASQLVVEESEDNFAFRHALTREAIRSELLRRERRELSLRIGLAIERLHAGEVENRAEDLSWHFFEGNEWPKAFAYSMIAGKRALALFTAGAAVGHLTRAIEAGGRVDDAGLSEAFRLRGTANEAIGDFDAALADYERAAAEDAGDKKVRWRALLDLGLLWSARDYSQAEPYLRKALELARELNDPAAIAQSLDRLGNWHVNTGDVGSAQAMSEEALAIFRELGDEAGVAQTLDLLGITCTLGMRFQQAAAYYREAIPRLEALDDRRTLTSALAAIQIGSGSAQTNMYPPALTLKEGSAFGERAVVLAREMGWKADESFALWQLAFTTAPQGKLSQGLAYAREALAIARDIGHTQWEAGSECAVGAILIDLFATTEAQEHLRRAIDLGQEMKSQLWVCQAQAMLIDALLAARQDRAALDLYESIAIDDLRGFGPSELFTSGAEALIANGHLDRAFDMLNSLEAAAEGSARDKAALRLQRMRAHALADSGRSMEAIEVLEAARRSARDQENLSYEWRLSAQLAHAELAQGDRQAARMAANEAIDQIDALASAIEDDGLRRNFLERAMELVPGPLRRRGAQTAVAVLTAREHEVAQLVAEGLTSREIADRLVLSSRTVESHIANAMSKLGFATRSQLAAWAAERRQGA